MSNAARRVKFIATDNVGLPLKRRQVSNACDDCRAKKRRCDHHIEGTESEAVADRYRSQHSSPPHPAGASSMSLPPVALPQKRPRTSSGEVGAAPSSSSPTTSGQVRQEQQLTPVNHASSRFVGDLNPEGMFLEATSASESLSAYNVGVWFTSGVSSSSNQPSQFITARPPPMMDRFMLPFVREHCLSCLPSNEDFLKFKSIFIQKVHPIFPIIPLSCLEGTLENPCNIVLRQLVCLAAGTDPQVSPYLRLQNRGRETLTPQDFSQSLSSAVRATLETSIIGDRVLHIRALAMLSLYTQPTCPEEDDIPSQLSGRAIHHIQTLGLHSLRYEAPNSADLNTLFCAVWALDRINAAIYGRPCLFHERDIGTSLDNCIGQQEPCFRLLLSVVQWLDQVIELYRPGPSAEVDGLSKVAFIDLPVLEAMIVDADALKVPSPLVATVETFYHAVIVLSCRLPRPGTSTAASTLPPSSANARRSLAADRIACAVPRDHLSPMPLIPYAISLALSVEYRKMRHSRLPMFRARAMTAFCRNCDLLRGYADYFRSAKVMAGLGDRVLKEMERAATTLNRDATPLAPDGTSRPTAAVATAAHGVQQVDPSARTPTTANATADPNNMADFSLIDAISGSDFFGHIDPNFDLDAVEDALEANLDIGLPLNWGDWGQFSSHDQ